MLRNIHTSQHVANVCLATKYLSIARDHINLYTAIRGSLVQED